MKQIRKKVEVHCYSCNAIILKEDSEVKRNQKLQRNNFCSKSCAGKSLVNLLHLRKIQPGVSSLISNNRRDEFTGFREHLARANRRNQNVNITLEDLKNTWEQQKGICPYSKVKLQFVSLKNKNNPIYTMSLDRKNSALGYIKGNIQFISIAMNLMKSSMSEEEMEQLLLIIKNSAD